MRHHFFLDKTDQLVTKSLATAPWMNRQRVDAGVAALAVVEKNDIGVDPPRLAVDPDLRLVRRDKTAYTGSRHPIVAEAGLFQGQ